jgi:CspA family cold shock protein
MSKAKKLLFTLALAAVIMVAAVSTLGSAQPVEAAGSASPTISHRCVYERGSVKWFNEKIGYGFITRDNGGDVFVHFSSIQGTGYRNLEDGQRVAFCVVRTPKGPTAIKVSVLGTSVRPSRIIGR